MEFYLFHHSGTNFYNISEVYLLLVCNACNVCMYVMYLCMLCIYVCMYVYRCTGATAEHRALCSRITPPTSSTSKTCLIGDGPTTHQFISVECCTTLTLTLTPPACRYSSAIRGSFYTISKTTRCGINISSTRDLT